jgi:ribosomal protein L14E/L6E/L27E
MEEKKNLEGTNMKIDRVKMSPEEIEEKKLFLMGAKLNKLDSDIQLEELEEQLAQEIPKKMLEDSIKEIKEDIKNKVIRRQTKEGYEKNNEASEADVELMKIKLKSLLKMQKADLPMGDLRYQIAKLRSQKERIDSPEKQIKKLEKELREGYASVLVPRDEQTYTD